MTQFDIQSLAWDKMNGLIPAIVQHYQTLDVLMLGYVNQDALNKTLMTNRVTFYSRSKEQLWTKGETSGNFLDLIAIKSDCDEDSLIFMVNPLGPTCHKGTASCFKYPQGSRKTQTTPLETSPFIVSSDNETFAKLNFLMTLEHVIRSRYHQPKSTSYTSELFQAGIARIAQKVGEEGVEVALAAVQNNINEIKAETADLIFHVLVLLQACNLSILDVLEILQKRHS